MFENGGMEESAFLTAPEAAQVLGVKLETLYAYVSRGLIRSERIAAGPPAPLPARRRAAPQAARRSPLRP